jgi:hypothetical protein
MSNIQEELIYEHQKEEPSEIKIKELKRKFREAAKMAYREFYKEFDVGEDQRELLEQ